PPLEMSSLPPRVREIEMDGLTGFRSYKVAKKDAGVRVGQPYVGQPSFGHASSCKELVLPGILDADKVGRWVSLGGAQEKQPLPKSDFDFHKLVVVEYFRPEVRSRLLGQRQQIGCQLV